MPRAPFLALALLAMTLNAPAQNAGPDDPEHGGGDDAEVTILERRDHRVVASLPNRLVIIAQRIPTAPVVSAQCWIKTGSVFEQQHNGAGLSHFLEHLVSGGTTDARTEAESSAALGRIGAQTNAATSLDTVRYYINTAAEHAPTAVDLLSDWMLNAKITETEYQRERQVIQREFDMGRGEPNRIFWKLTQQARYQAHPARHPTIGYLDEFLTISRDEIYSFYKTMYVPNNMVFVVVGDIDPDAMVKHVASRFAHAEPRDLPDLALPVEPALDDPPTVTGVADLSRPRLRLAWPGARLAGEHDYALDLLATVLGDGELSRLNQTLRDEQRRVVAIDAYNLSFEWGEGFFGVDATVADFPVEADDGRAEHDARLAAVKRAVLQQIARVREEGVTKAELDRAKAKTLASVVYSAQTADGAASRLARDFINKADPDYLDRYAEAIGKLTPDDLQAAARAILPPGRAITVRLLPGETVQAMDRPDAPEGEFETEPVELDNARLIERFKARADDEVRARAAELDKPRMFTLDNGLRVIVQRDTRLPIVAMQWYQRGGLLADRPGEQGAANAAAAMLLKGAGDRSADDIARLLESRGARLSADAGNNTTYVNGLCLADDWPDVLALMADVIQNPAFPEDEWAKLQPRLLAAVDAVTDRWTSHLFSAFRNAYFGEGHPWAATTVGRRDAVQALTPDDLKRFHKRHLSAGQSVLAIVGDVDPDAVRKAAARRFTDLPAEAADPVDPPGPVNPAPGRRYARTAKPLTAVHIGFPPGLTRDADDYPAVAVMNKVVSNFPSGWLHQALRGEGPGLVYAAYAYNFTGLAPGYWAMAFNTSAESKDQAIERSLAIADRLRNEKVDDATLQRAVNAAVVGEAFGRQAPGQRATAMALDELYGVGYANSAQQVQRLREVTPKDIRQAANKYLNDPVILILTNQPPEE